MVGLGGHVAKMFVPLPPQHRCTWPARSPMPLPSLQTRDGGDYQHPSLDTFTLTSWTSSPSPPQCPCPRSRPKCETVGSIFADTLLLESQPQRDATATLSHTRTPPAFLALQPDVFHASSLNSNTVHSLSLFVYIPHSLTVVPQSLPLRLRLVSLVQSLAYVR